MKVSIITVAFNAADTIDATIRSVAAQTHDDFEYIVVDGCSTDGSMRIVDRFRSLITKVVCEPDRGMYDAMNKGIALATGDVIGFLNADDVYADNKVIKDVAHQFKDPGVEACYGDLVYTKRDDIARVVRYWKAGTFQSGAFGRGWIPPHPTFFVRSSVYKQYGGFDPSYTLAADVELMARLLEKYAIRTVYLPRVLVKMRMGGVSNRSMATVFFQNVAIRRALQANGVKCSWPFFIGKPVNRIRQLIEGALYREP